MARLENRLLELERISGMEKNYSRKLSILVPDDATDSEMQQAHREYLTNVYRESADPFGTSFLG